MARARRQQPDLPAPGMSRIERPSIEEPAEDLRAITGELATLNERKRNAQATLLAAMDAEGIKLHKYLDPDGVERKAEVVAKPRARVERVKGTRKPADVEPQADVPDDVTVQ